MTTEEVQSAWKNISNIGCTNYKLLTRDQRGWFNIEQLILFGLFDHYVNHAAAYNKDTIEDLEYLGFSNIAELLRQFNSLFENGDPPVNIDLRNEEMGDWNEEKRKLVDDLEDRFWSECDNLENTLMNFIINTGIAK